WPCRSRHCARSQSRARPAPCRCGVPGRGRYCRRSPLRDLASSAGRAIARTPEAANPRRGWGLPPLRGSQAILDSTLRGRLGGGIRFMGGRHGRWGNGRRARQSNDSEGSLRRQVPGGWERGASPGLLGRPLRDERIYNGLRLTRIADWGRIATTVMKNLPLSKVYQLLEPGPVVLLTTAQNGHANVMTMSWHMMVEFEPPLVACVVSSADYSFAALRATKECVIAVP